MISKFYFQMVIFPLAGVLRGFYVIDVLNVRLDENPCAALGNKKIPHLLNRI